MDHSILNILQNPTRSESSSQARRIFNHTESWHWECAGFFFFAKLTRTGIYLKGAFVILQGKCVYMDFSNLFQSKEWALGLLSRACGDKVLSWTKGMMALSRWSQKFWVFCPFKEKWLCLACLRHQSLTTSSIRSLRVGSGASCQHFSKGKIAFLTQTHDNLSKSQRTLDSCSIGRF